MQAQQMNEKLWKTAHKLAFDLVDWGTDPNELGKVIAFVRRHQDDTDAKSRLMLLVQRLASSRNALIRSRQTQGFYQNIQEAFSEHLRNISNPAEILLILGWSLRLMRYYRAEPTFAVEYEFEPSPVNPPAPPTPAPPTPKPEPPKVKAGDRVNATVLKKDGFKVTVQLQTDAREEVTFDGPYYPGQIGQVRKLRVIEVDSAGKVRKVVP